MWILCSNQDAACVKPLKPPKHEESAGAPYNPSFWIRPGKRYTAGRAEAFDLYITHPKLSRKKTGFTLTASAIDPADTLQPETRAPSTVSYSLTIEAGEQELLILKDDGSEEVIRAGHTYLIRDGLRINAFGDKKRECIMTFRWHPVHIYLQHARKLNLPPIQQLAQTFASIGATLTASSTLKIPPNTTHTHAVLSKMGSNPTALQLVAANCQLLMVHAGWIEALEEAAKPEWITNGENEERKRVEKSKLELDFERHWPSEIKHFPTFDERQATSAEKQFWSPNIKRRTLFEGSVFLNFSKDPNVPALVTTAGGQVIHPDLSDEAAFATSVRALCEALNLKTATPKKYLVTPMVASLTSDREHSILRQAKELAGIEGYVTIKGIFTALTGSTSVTDVQQDYDDQTKNTERSSEPAPTPSMPGATADISFPATHPDDVAASAPAQLPLVSDDKVTKEAKAVAEARPNKRPRKLADRGVIDPFASMFASSNAIAPTVSAGAVLEKESQLASQLSSASSKRPETQDNQSQARYLRPDSKYSKLKRRVGQGSASQLEGPSGPAIPEDEEEPPVKKFKTFNPDIESLESQAAARLKGKEERQQLRRPTEVEEDEEEEEVKPIASKRKAAEMQLDSDEDAAEGATQAPSRKKAAPSKESAKTSKAKAEAVNKDAYRESVYLQVKTGRRKIGKADADINEDFNNLRLKRSQIPESHKMGWNERDVFQEEMAEDAVWEAEDKSTFFQIRFVPMVRPKEAATRTAPVSDPRYAGKPNFKAFKPKNLVTNAARSERTHTRPQIELVAHEALGYGLRESYGDGEGPRTATRDKSDSEESVQMPMPNLNATKKSKGKTKASAPAGISRASKSKRPVMADSSDEDELEHGDSSTAREESVPAATSKRTKESITIESSSDEDDGRTFRGFSASNRITARKR